MKQEKRGGLRTPPGGRPKKTDKRITVQICLSPDNAEYLAALGREKNNFLNSLLDRERQNRAT